MMPFWWACWTAWQTGTNSSSRCAGRQAVLVAVLGDRHALDQLHDEVGPAGCRWCRRRARGRCWGGPSGPGPAARPRSGRGPAGVSMPGLMSFRATLRLDRLRSARPCRRCPCRPRRSARSSLYGPMTVPGRSRGSAASSTVAAGAAAGDSQEAAGPVVGLRAAPRPRPQRRVAAAGLRRGRRRARPGRRSPAAARKMLALGHGGHALRVGRTRSMRQCGIGADRPRADEFCRNRGRRSVAAARA